MLINMYETCHTKVIIGPSGMIPSLPSAFLLRQRFLLVRVILCGFGSHCEFAD